MHPFTHSQTHRLQATSQGHSTLVQSHPRHPNQLPGGPAEHTLQLFPTGRCPLLPLAGLNEPTQHPLPTASLPQCQWPQREAEAGGILCNLTVWTLASDCSARDTPRQPNRGCTMVYGGGKPNHPLGWPLLLGYRHVSKSRCGPAVKLTVNSLQMKLLGL